MNEELDDIEFEIEEALASREAKFGFALLVAIAIAAIWLAVSEMDYRDQVSEQEFNCAMVEEGKYPAEQFPYCQEDK